MTRLPSVSMMRAFKPSGEYRVCSSSKVPSSALYRVWGSPVCTWRLYGSRPFNTRQNAAAEHCTASQHNSNNCMPSNIPAIYVQRGCKWMELENPGIGNTQLFAGFVQYAKCHVRHWLDMLKASCMPLAWPWSSLRAAPLTLAVHGRHEPLPVINDGEAQSWAS